MIKKFRCTACAATVPAGTMYCPKCDKPNVESGTYVGERETLSVPWIGYLLALILLAMGLGAWFAGKDHKRALHSVVTQPTPHVAQK